MTFRQAILICLSKYFTFSGRARRSEYWWFFLFCVLGGLIFSALESFINGVTMTEDGPQILSAAFNVMTFVPSLAVGFRRMHDTGRSGLYLFYPLIAMVGLGIFISLFGGDFAQTGDPAALTTGFGLVVLAAIIVIVLSPFFVLYWLTRPSEPGTNQYGPNPMEEQS